jgi:alkanesulfonate monooxygenase SsuD/methylene tetrahydromethanopterin reductase-like flavin-dependent oxidoreductase (luciferase family)
VVYHTLEAGTQHYVAMKAAAAAVGRNPDGMNICTLFHPVCAATKAEAEDKQAAYDTLPTALDQLSLLSEALNYDLASKGMDEPLTDEELAGIVGMHSMRDRVVQCGVQHPTVRDCMRITGRGLLTHAWVGGPTEGADRIEEWFTAPACDGFVVGPTHQPGCFEDFVTYMVPELQRRDLYRKDYTGVTLRDHLGLVRPALGAWRTTPDTAHSS